MAGLLWVVYLCASEWVAHVGMMHGPVQVAFRGFSVVATPVGPVVYIETTLVHPDWQGQGLYKKLTEEMLRFLEESVRAIACVLSLSGCCVMLLSHARYCCCPCFSWWWSIFVLEMMEVVTPWLTAFYAVSLLCALPRGCVSL